MPPFDFVGPYELGEKLGQGGMGSVYRALHAKTKEPVAVKIIAAHVADEPRFRRRFDAEVKTLMSLQHPGIVKLIGFGEEHGQLFYSMELVEGESLQSLIKSEKKLDWGRSIDFAIEICTALKHAHDVGVIHRDLKPANLIVTADQNLKLVDFGIAKIFGDQQQTVVGSMLGTLDYMAPEQVDSESITVRTDLYAVGSVLYCMLAGRPPFRGKNATQVLDMLKNQPATRLDSIDPAIPEILVELVHELLAKDPQNRPPTALAVTKRLMAMRVGLEKFSANTQVNDSNGSGFDKTKATRLNDGETQATLPTQALPADFRPEGVSTNEIPTKTQATEHKQSTQTLASGDFTLMGASSSSSQSNRGELQQDDRGDLSVQTVHANTVATSGQRTGESDQPAEIQTHFQEVQSARDANLQQDNGQISTGRWNHWIGMASLVCILAVGLVIFLRSMKPPTSDELYDQAVSSGGASAQRAFIKNFPEDPRRLQVEDRLMLNQLQASAKRISTQKKIGIKQLSPAELAFLGVFESTSIESVEGQLEAMESWLVAFGQETVDSETASLVELVRYENSRLKSGRPDPRSDQRLIELFDKIEEIVRPGGADQQRQLQSLLELFDQEEWAEPAMDRIHQILDDHGNQKSEDENDG